MPLEEYIRKRNFSNTPEPEGYPDTSESFRFVVQRHNASHLHYDLRLEIEGVLKSWAVPKGPSMNPGDKRLSIQTEDHPVKYLRFEGTIPKGNYGAGDMIIWDEGRFAIAEIDKGDAITQWENGNLKLQFFGKKMRGNFALVRTKAKGKQNQWLLIKKRDQFATDLEYDAENFIHQESEKENHTSKKEVLSLQQFVKPMLAGTATAPFADPDWIYELKWDGYRMITHIKNGVVEMYSRNGISLAGKFPGLLPELQSIDHDVILDGEVVVTDEKGLSQFQLLQNYNGAQTEGHLQYYVFDLLYLNGHDTINLTLTDRKSLLPDVLEGLQSVVYCDHIVGMGIAFYERAVERGMEGVMAKKANSLYVPGHRSTDWLKVKAIEGTEAIICGYTQSEAKGRPFGSLILGQFKEGKLQYKGNCGSGFSSNSQKELAKLFAPLEIKKSPFQAKVNLKGRTPQWMQPELICEVNFSEWTTQGMMRHPVFKGLREDKMLNEIGETMKPEEIKQKHSLGISSDSSLKIDGISVPFTHLEKVYWPQSGLRKYDLIDYYIKVSETLLPYLKDRPQNLHRFPNGIGSKGFYQKDNESLPSWASTATIHSKSAEKDIDYLLCQNEATLLYMANLGCIEINPWNSRVGNLDSPDYTVIDIDPSDKNTFEQAIETALAAKEVLQRGGIEGVCKTTGKSGIHIYIPLKKGYSYDEARDFTKLLCYYIHEKLPKLTSLERAVKKRKGKVYLDYLQNRYGQTLAAPYCVRPVADAPVSAPLEWEELEANIKPTDFNLHNMPERLKKRGDIFAPVLQKGITIEKVLDKLEG